MTTAVIPVRTEADILPDLRKTPVGSLLRYHNLGASLPAPASPEILVASCLDGRLELRVPAGFAITLTTAAASLKRVPFKVSWAIGVAGVSAIALVAHEDCGMVGLRQHRDSFVARMVETAGWAQSAAEQHFDHWSDLFEIDDPTAFVVEEAQRLRHRYPGLVVAPLLLQSDSGKLAQLRL